MIECPLCKEESKNTDDFIFHLASHKWEEIHNNMAALIFIIETNREKEKINFFYRQGHTD
jgi:hypothetical protein